LTGLVDTLTKIFAGLEVRYVLAGQRNGLTCLGIAPNTGRPKMQGKTAKAANLDALP